MALKESNTICNVGQTFSCRKRRFEIFLHFFVMVEKRKGLTIATSCQCPILSFQLVFKIFSTKFKSVFQQTK